MKHQVCECKGCIHYRGDSVNSVTTKYCHYALNKGKCRIINGRIVPPKECYRKKIFFEGRRKRGEAQ